MVDLDSETLFNAAAAILSTAAALFFVFDVDLGHSPVSEIALVVLFLAGILLVTQRTEERQLTVLGYGVIVTSSVALFLDAVNTFGVGDPLIVLGLLGIAGLLFYLRTRLDGSHRFLTETQATYAFGAVAVLTAGVLLVDVVTGGLAYELRPESEIEYADTERETVRVASVAVTNPTPFPERVQTPNYEACAAGNWSEFRPPSDPDEPRRDVHLHASVQDGYNEYVLGYSTNTYPVELHVEGADLQGETFPVRVTSTCPDEGTGSPYVALFETRDSSYGYAD